MKLTLLWVLPFAAEVALARPAEPGESRCISANTGGNIFNGICSNEKQADRVLYTPVHCTIGKCSVRAPRCDTPAGLGLGFCMDPEFVCSQTDYNNGQPGRPGTRIQGACFEAGVICCDGRVGNAVSLALPSQFTDAILPSDDQLSSPADTDLFLNTPDQPLQYSLLNTPNDLYASDPSASDLFASDPLASNDLASNDLASNNIPYPDDLLAANDDSSWFQT